MPQLQLTKPNLCSDTDQQFLQELVFYCTFKIIYLYITSSWRDCRNNWCFCFPTKRILKKSGQFAFPERKDTHQYTPSSFSELALYSLILSIIMLHNIWFTLYQIVLGPLQKIIHYNVNTIGPLQRGCVPKTNLIRGTYHFQKRHEQQYSVPKITPNIAYSQCK